MKNKLLFGALLSGIVFLGAGCASDASEEDKSKLPAGTVETSRENTTPLEEGPGSSKGVGAWQDPASFGGNVDKDGWREADPSGRRLNMPVIYFKYDSDVLVSSETANLDKIARYLSDKPDMGLVIEGHCDQRGTEEYNRALGERRANAIRAYLVKRGVADYKIKTVSYGEDKPAVSGNGESAWKQNRRGVPVPMFLPANK